ncbi:hypothetical protein F5Y14DRAFT_120651 [Nemania sp. NC0429]|nr:hypothetical protein F5Y14DRAFT_120651 [Nemania sp. NC0429]
MSARDSEVRNPDVSSLGAGSSHDLPITTTIDGRLINPLKLENMLKARFGKHYDVELRNDRYTIKTPGTIRRSDINECY